MVYRRRGAGSSFGSGLLSILMPAAILVGIGACSNGPSSDPEAELTARLRAELPLFETPAKIPYPEDNPPLSGRIALGRLLFFDPLLSGDDDVACATCHHPAFAWADGRDVSIGVGGVGIGPDRVRGLTGAPTEFTTPRNSPTILDAAFNRPFLGDGPSEGRMFWDGRTSSLELQAQAPIRSRDEMRHDAYTAPEALLRVLEDLRSVPEYLSLFTAAFPEDAAEVLRRFGPGNEALVINGSTYSRALAAYERELCTMDSPFDRFVRGDDAALSHSQKRGLDLFFRSGCGECHSGPMFSDYEFHVLGVKQGGAGKPPLHEDGDGTDLGRYLESGAEQDRYAFRTPTLRNVALTAPYFHTGGVGFSPGYADLRAVIDFHRRGGNDEGLAPSEVDPLLRQVELSEEDVLDLVAFLESLSAERLRSDLVDPTVPTTVPSGLTPPPVLPPALTNDFGG